MRKREEIAWIEKREFQGESIPVPFDNKTGNYQFIDDLKSAYRFLFYLRKNDKENLYRLVREEKEIIIGQWV